MPYINDNELDFEGSLVQLKFNLLLGLTQERAESAKLPFIRCNVTHDASEKSLYQMPRSILPDSFSDAQDTEPQIWSTLSGNAVLVPEPEHLTLIFRFDGDEIPKKYYGAIEKVFARYEKVLDHSRYWKVLTGRLDSVTLQQLSDYCNLLTEETFLDTMVRGHSNVPRSRQPNSSNLMFAEILGAGAVYGVRRLSIQELGDNRPVLNVLMDGFTNREIELTYDPLLDTSWIARSRPTDRKDPESSPSYSTELYRKAPFDEAKDAVWRLLKFTQFAKTYFEY